jgi:hypothetical protein
MAMLSGCASPRSAADYATQYATWQGQVTTALRQQGDVDSLIALAFLRRSVSEPRHHTHPDALAALHAAIAITPTHRPVAALRLQACLAALECDVAEAAVHLRRIDPGNGLADLADLRAAMLRNDAAATDAALASLAAATAFNTYFNANVVAAADALERTQLPAAADRRRNGAAEVWLYTVIDGVALYATVGVQEFARTCNGPDTADARRSSCLRITDMLMRSDTLTMQSFATRQALRMAQPDSPEVLTAAELRRRLDWYNDALNAGLKPWNFRRTPGMLLVALRDHPREEDARRALLAALNIVADPPVDWAPK